MFCMPSNVLSICNLNIPPWAYHGHLTPSLYLGVRTAVGAGNLTPNYGRWWISPFVHDEQRENVSNLADKILHSWPNGRPKMGCRNSDAFECKYEVPLSNFNMNKASGSCMWGIWTAFWDCGTGIWPPQITKYKFPGDEGRCWGYKLISA